MSDLWGFLLKDEKGRTLLLEGMFRKNNKTGYTLFHLLAEDKSMATLTKLVKHPALTAEDLIELLKRKNQDGNTFLHVAALSKNFLPELTREILEKDGFLVSAHLWAETEEGNTFLHVAAKNNALSTHLIETILKKIEHQLCKDLLNKTNHKGNTFLHEAAAEHGSLRHEVVRLIADAVAWPERLDLLTKHNELTNTFLHEAAKNKEPSLSKMTNVILNGKAYLEIGVLLLAETNQQGNTFLHEAAKHGILSDCLKKTVDVMTIPPCSDPKNAKSKQLMSEKNNQGRTFMGVAVNTAGLKDEKTSADDIEATLQHHFLPAMKDCSSFFDDTAETTLLHMTTKLRLKKMTSVLGNNKPGLLNRFNSRGFTPLHVAVYNDDIDMFQFMVSEFNKNLDINQQTQDGETALHLACKKGLLKMMETIVEQGGDLSYQDDDGHTPLHDLLQHCNLEGKGVEHCHEFREVWEKLVEVAATWWCTYLNIQPPNPLTEEYVELRRDAMYYLRSCVENKDGLSVLQYAAELGMVDCVNVMLTEEHVFVTPQKDGERADQRSSGDDDKFRHMIEVTNLCPEYKAEIWYDKSLYRGLHEAADHKHTSHKLQRSAETYQGATDIENITTDVLRKKLREERKRETNNQEEDSEDELGDEGINGGSTLVQLLSTMEPPLKSTPILQGIPLRKLTAWQWQVYQVFSIFWLIVHFAIMSISTIYTEEELQSFALDKEKTAGALGRSSRQKALDIFLVFYAWLLFLSAAVTPTIKLVKRLRAGAAGVCSCFGARPDQPDTNGQNDKGCGWFSCSCLEDNEDTGVLNMITKFMEVIAEQVQIIIPLMFAISAAVILAQGNNMDQDTFAWLRGACLLFGWLIVLIPARTYSPIYNFISTLKFIFLKDMIAFLLFFLIITIAFACAMQLQFQLLVNKSVAQGVSETELPGLLHNIRGATYELVLMAIGMDTDLKHVKGVSDLFNEHSMNGYWIRTLLIAYGVLSVLILLNMLIAMMGTTLTVVMETEGTGWRQHQVRQVQGSYLVWTSGTMRKNAEDMKEVTTKRTLSVPSIF